MVNSLLMVPLMVRPRRLSLSIGRCSAYERSNDGAGHQPRQAVRGAVAERHLADQLAVDHLAHAWRVPVSSSGAVATTVTSVGDARRLQREVHLQAIADAHIDRSR